MQVIRLRIPVTSRSCLNSVNILWHTKYHKLYMPREQWHSRKGGEMIPAISGIVHVIANLKKLKIKYFLFVNFGYKFNPLF